MIRAEASDAKSRRKQLGAYYTDDIVARFVMRWALTTGRETVLDPSFGGGVFLRAATERIRELGGDPRAQIAGIEIDDAAIRESSSDAITGASLAQVRHANFFDVRTGDFPAVDVVVGNPPFIRYQRFTGEARKVALKRATEAGVEISGLASSWAPFLVHAVRFVKAGGSLGMVLPAEVAHAGYARPILSYLRREFCTLRILTFERRLFPNLSEGTILLLASGRGLPFEDAFLIDFPDLQALDRCSNPVADLPLGDRLDMDAVLNGSERVAHYLLPARTKRLYQQLRVHECVHPLRDFADIGIGYVSGDNDFFHPRREIIEAHGLPERFLRRAIRSGSDLDGLRYSSGDWESHYADGRANQLLLLPRAERLPDSVQNYLAEGEQRGVPLRYKCRIRQPWYSVPHVHRADGFLTCMSGSAPKLVANQSGAVTPNALHVVRLHVNLLSQPTSVLALATLWQTSLTALSCEMEGHSLGGGMLKLEPTEAERVFVVKPAAETSTIESLGDELDPLLRSDGAEMARDRADEAFLCKGIGLCRSDVDRLRDGWALLRRRRLNQ